MGVRGTPPDAEVVALVLAGDTEAFGVVIRRYEAGLLRFATRMLGSRDSVADVPLDDAPPVADPSDTEAALERADQLLLVERALGDLSPDKREAFVLKHVEGLSYEEMAAVTGERIPTRKMRVHRAREALLKVLEDHA